MKIKRRWLIFLMGLYLLPVWGSDNPEELSNEYQFICNDCAERYQAVIQKDAFKDLDRLKSNLLPIIAAAEQLNDDQFLARLYPRLRYVYTKETNYINAIKIGLAYLKLPLKYLSEEKIIREHGALSEFYSQLGIRDEAYRHHLIALKGVQDTENLDLKFRILYQSGSVFFFQKRYQQAINFYKQALEVALNSIELEKKVNVAISGLASTYVEIKEYQLAKKYIDKQLQESLPLNIKAHAYEQLGSLFSHQGALDSAQHYYQKSLVIFQNLSSHLNEAEINLSLGELAVSKKEFLPAIDFFLAVLADEELQNIEYQARANRGLAKAFESKGDFVTAFQYQKTFSDLQPFLFQDSSSLKLDKLRMEFLLEEQAEEMVRLDTEKLIFATGAILLFLILLGVGWLLNQKRQALRLVVQQKKQIEEQNGQLTNYNQRLKRFNSVVSHDLKQPLRTSISMIGLFKRKYLSDLTDDGKEFLDISGQSLKQMYKLIEGLLNLTSLEKASDKDMDWMNAATPLIDVQTQLYTLIEEKQAEIIISPSVDHWPNIYAHESHIIQLWQNLIANAIKFTPLDRVPRIEISVIEQKYQYRFVIKDNGIGIEEVYQDQIFEMFSRLNDRVAFEGNGIGLATCKRIVELHGGEISVGCNSSYIDGRKRNGSTFYFTLPKRSKSISISEKRLLKAV